MADELTPKQQAFVDQYLISLNATKAYQDVYGAKPAVAWTNGSRLLKTAKIAAVIEQRRGKLADAAGLTHERLREELGVLAYSSIWDYEIDNDGNVVLAPGAKPEAIRAIASIKRKSRTIPRKDGEPIVEHETEIRLWNKPTAIQLAGQHRGMFVDLHKDLTDDPSKLSDAELDKRRKALVKLA